MAGPQPLGEYGAYVQNWRAKMLRPSKEQKEGRDMGTGKHKGRDRREWEDWWDINGGWYCE